MSLSPDSARSYHHTAKADSTHTIFATSLLGTPPNQMPPEPFHSPTSPAETLPPISPAASAPLKLKSIRELGLYEWNAATIAPPTTGSRVIAPSSSTFSTPTLADHSPQNHFENRALSDAETEDQGRSPSVSPAAPLRRQLTCATLASSPQTPNIGKLWWDSVIVAHASANSPAIAVCSPTIPEIGLQVTRPSLDGEEIDELAGDDHMHGYDYGVKKEKTFLPSYSPRHAPRNLPSHHFRSSSLQMRPVTADAGTLPRLSTITRTVSASPSIRGVTLPYEHYHGHPRASSSSPVSPAGSTSSLPASLSPAGRRMKPNHLNRQHVPLYNRSKAPTGTAEALFVCNYVPPRSTNPRAPQPTSHPCETTALKKADMERHFEEIHAKDESERILRGEFELELASRYLIDLAAIVGKEMKHDPLGTSMLPSGRTIRNLDLRAQADNVRLRVGQAVTLEIGPTPPFDFKGNGCEEFRELAIARLATYRVWRCIEPGCDKQFGSQRSMERHKANKHPAATKRDAYPITSDLGASGFTQGSRKRPAADLGSPFSSTSLPSSPYNRPSLNLDTNLHPPPAKRQRKESPLKIGGSLPSPAMMRVRQQTPERRSPEFGYTPGLGLSGDYRDRSMISRPDVDVDERLLELAEGRVSS